MHELQRVVLTRDVPEHGLATGDVGTIVLIHRDEAGYEVEFAGLDGATVAVVTLDQDDVREVRPREVTHARLVAGGT